MRSVAVVGARVPVVKLVVGNQHVDITVEQEDRRAATAVEHVEWFRADTEAALGPGGGALFSHSVILVKAFIKYESGGGGKGGKDCAYDINIQCTVAIY